MKQIIIHPSAAREIEAAFDWYAARSAQAPDRLLAEIEAALHQISSTPSRFPAHLHGTRRAVLQNFPYLIVFLRISDRTFVIAVAHASRNPGYWRDRVPEV